MSVRNDPLDAASPLINGIPASLNHEILSYLDPDRDAATIGGLPVVCQVWNADRDVQQFRSLARSLAMEIRNVNALFPRAYVDAFRNAGKPIFYLPYIDLGGQNSITPPIDTIHSVVRGRFGLGQPFIQLRLENRPNANNDQDLDNAEDLDNDQDLQPPREIRDKIIFIFQRYIQDNFSVIIDNVLEFLIIDRHMGPDHNSMLICDDCPFKEGRIHPTLLQNLLSGNDPDFQLMEQPQLAEPPEESKTHSD